MTYQLYREQQLNCDLDTAWNFFSSPYNLAKITPKDMHFTVLTQLRDDVIYSGMKIDYTVSPLWGIPVRWRTCITRVEEKKCFTDVQEKGPYKMWVHTHEFIPNSRGVLMKDFISYQLPLGVLGRWAHALFVKKRLRTIFDYRFFVLRDMF